MTKRSAILKGKVIYNEDGVATETIKPGYLVKGVSTIANQTGTTGFFQVAVAVERDELGAGFDNTHQGSGTPTAFYASGDTVKVAVCPRGTQITGWIASGQNIVEDDKLESAGDGTFAEGATRPIVRALESPGVVTTLTAIKLEVL